MEVLHVFSEQIGGFGVPLIESGFQGWKNNNLVNLVSYPACAV